MDIAVVIVNYRTADLTVDCLRSLIAERAMQPGVHVYVTDNLSNDGSVEKLARVIVQEQWSDWVTLMPLERNGGFAYGNNAAIRAALAAPQPPRYVLLLNPDTVVRPGAIRELAAYMDANPKTGIAGSRLEDPDGTPQRSAFRFPGVFSELDAGLRLGIVTKVLSRWMAAPPVSDVSHSTDWVAGASMMIRRDVFEKIGLLDEAYFMYYEEVDFCLAARRAGWRCDYVPASHVVHLVGQASGVTDTKRAPKRLPAYWFESRRRFFVKNRGTLAAIAADMAFASGFALWRLRRPIQRKPDLDPPHLLGDMLRHSPLLGSPRRLGRDKLMVTDSEPIGFIAQLKEDWIAHRRDWTRPGFRAVAVHRFGNWRMKVQPKILRAPFSMLYRAMFRHVRNHYGIELSYEVKLGRRVVFEHQGAVVIHGNSVIGDDCIIRQGVTLGNRYIERHYEAPTLGRGVSVGAGAKILGALTIGDGAVIGANAVVLRDVPAHQTAVGIPARILNKPAQTPSLTEEFAIGETAHV